MKAILSLIISATLVVSGYSQTRNVLVGTNNAVVQPTNFWSADVTNARSGLGLGSAATNPASAFQSSSATLSNLAASNGVDLTNLAASNMVGTLSLGQGGTGSTNAADARTALGLETAATNSASAFQPSSTVLSNLASSNGGSLTNITASNVTGTIAISNGGSGATTAGGARTNLGLGATNDVAFKSASFSATDNEGYVYAITLGQTNTGFKNVAGDTNSYGFTYLGTNVWYNAGSLLGVGTGLYFANDTASATTRTNLRLGWSALTNSNAGTGLVSVNTNGEVVSPTNFWQVAPIQTLVQDFTLIGGTQTNNATNARNLYVYSLNTNLTGVSNTIILPTNAATFNGDEATVVHKGTTNTTTVIRQAGSTNNLITLSRFDESVKFIRELGQWDFYHNISFVEPIQFSGTNASSNAAASRTNLGLGATWLTNTNVTNFRSAIGLGATNDVSFDDVQAVSFLVGDATNSQIAFEGNSAATTRTNLGLGATNNVTFSALTLSSDLTLGSGDNIVLSTTTGTKIGTATNQLLGFYNQTPITQPSSTGVTTSGFTGGSGATVHPQSTFTGGIGTNAYTISDIVAHLKSLGLIAP